MASEHLSRMALMRLLVDEAGREERQADERHLAGCGHCADALAELRALQDEGRREAPRMIPRRRTPSTIWTGLALAGASAAALVVFTVLPGDPGIRAKGGARVEFACKDGPRVWECRTGEQVRPGTALAIRVQLDAPGWLMLLGRDGSGVWRSYFPADGQALPAEPGGRDPFGQSLVLDDAPGEERFVLVLAPRAFGAQELIAGQGEEPSLRLPAGFQRAELVLRK